jgi:Fe-S oxidoreductase
VAAFEELKRVFDPGNLMNPGKVVHPARLDEHLKLGGDWSPATPQDLFFRYPNDGGSFAQAAGRCVGVGKCRHHDNKGGAVMCPSYQVTMEEEDSTRGRARLLFEMLDGHGDSPVTDGWRSDAVKDALDLCLSCKGCKSDCPAGVDMATYKAEFLAHHWQGRQWRRPRSDLALGWLPLTARAVTGLGLAPVVNAVTHTPLLHGLAMKLGGLEDREVPLFATQTFEQWFRARGPGVDGHSGDGRGASQHRGTVILWPDSFTNYFHPHVGQAAVEVLESAGWRVELPDQPVCCGLTWISTGQLDGARRQLRRSLDALDSAIKAGTPIVGLEPSCTAVLRGEITELLPADPRARQVRAATRTLAELLTGTQTWAPPDLAGVRAVAQPHCHHHAVMGWHTDSALLASAGAEVTAVGGCCGLAGNFGVERGHYDVSRAIAETALLPAVRQARDAVVLADGFSCRTQLDQLAHVSSTHLAQLLASHLDDHE